MSNNNEMLSVPFVVVEANAERHERERVRWFIVVIVLILLLFGSNAAWIYYESQFTEEVTEQTVLQSADTGSNKFIGGDYYGVSDSDNSHNSQS